jgi:hypothetical protein
MLPLMKVETMIVTRKRVLDDLQKSMDDTRERANICLALIDLGTPCRDRLLDITLDKSLDFVLRRWALKVASGFRDDTVRQFIRTRCLEGKSREQLLRTLGDDQESHSQMALFVTGEEILHTPDFFERYVLENV